MAGGCCPKDRLDSNNTNRVSLDIYGWLILHLIRRLALYLFSNLINNQFQLEQKSKSFFLFVRVSQQQYYFFVIFLAKTPGGQKAENPMLSAVISRSPFVLLPKK